MNPELEAALDALQAWADAHPQHLEALFGRNHAVTTTGQNALDCGLNYFGAQLVAESFWERSKAQPLDSVTISVAPTRTSMPDHWVVVSNRPMMFTELVAALSARAALAEGE